MGKRVSNSRPRKNITWSDPVRTPHAELNGRAMSFRLPILTAIRVVTEQALRAKPVAKLCLRMLHDV